MSDLTPEQERGFENHECGTCGTEGWRFSSVAGSPWRASCINGHEFILTGNDVTVEFDLEALSRLRSDLEAAREQGGLLTEQVMQMDNQKQNLQDVCDEYREKLGLAEAGVERLQDEATNWRLLLAERQDERDEARAEVERLRAELKQRTAASAERTQMDGAEVERLRAAVSRYADHDRACDARESSLYACICGFVAMIERLFPSRQALQPTKEGE